MSEKHIHSLLYKSAQIQNEIDKEHARLAPNRYNLIRLKKLRLKIKDRIMRIIAAHASGKTQRQLAQ